MIRVAWTFDQRDDLRIRNDRPAVPRRARVRPDPAHPLQRGAPRHAPRRSLRSALGAAGERRRDRAWPSRPSARRGGRADATGHWAFVRWAANLPAETAAGAGRRSPCLVVLGKASVHQAAVVKDAVPDLAAAGGGFGSLPPYGRELTSIEPI